MSAADLLKVVLPDPVQTDLLRACLLPQPAAGAALRRWKTMAGDPVEALMGQGSLRRRLAPLLRPALEGETGPLAVRVRAGELYEKERSAAYDAAAAETLAVLAPIGPVLLSRGHWLAVSAYPASGLRHRHDLDILVRPEQRRAAEAALVAAGFNSVTSDHFTHPGGLPVLLHERAVAPAGYAFDLWAEAESVSAYGAEILVPAPHALAAHLIVQAAVQPNRQSLLWAVDLAMMIRTGRVDWDALAAFSAGHPWRAHLGLALDWIAGALSLDIPRSSAEPRAKDVREALGAIRSTARVREMAPFARDVGGGLALMGVAASAARRRFGGARPRQPGAEDTRKQQS